MIKRMQLTSQPVTALARSTIEAMALRDALMLTMTCGQRGASPPRN